jgi:hypothetical protein
MPVHSQTSRRSIASAPLASAARPNRRPGLTALGLTACAVLLLTACGGPADEELASVDGAASVAGVTGLQLSSPTIAAGGAVTVTVNGPGGATVYLSYSRTALAGPRWIRIPSGNRSASFTLQSNPYLAASTAATISASTSSPDPYSLVVQTVTIAAASTQPATARPDVATVTFSPATVTSGHVATGTVTLTGPAPAGGAVVQLASSYDQFGQVAAVPATVLVPEGATSAPFAVPTHLAAPATQSDLPITGSYFGGPWRGSWLSVVAP